MSASSNRDNKNLSWKYIMLVGQSICAFDLSKNKKSSAHQGKTIKSYLSILRQLLFTLGYINHGQFISGQKCLDMNSIIYLPINED